MKKYFRPLFYRGIAGLASALVLGFVAAIFGGEAAAQPSDAEVEAWMGKPEVNLTKLGVTYWHIDEAWADRDAVVTIDDDEIAYSARCEETSFPYRQSEDVLEVSSIWKVSRQCGRLPSEAFLRFYFLLRQSESVNGGESLVVVVERPMMELFRLKRFEPVGLEFRRWIITEYFDGVGLMAPNLRYPDLGRLQGLPATVRPPTVTFNRGDLEGSPSCGALIGGYTLAGQSLKMHAGLFLMGYCPPEALSQNDRVLAALRRVSRFDRSGTQMILRGDKGEVEVVLAPA